MIRTKNVIIRTIVKFVYAVLALGLIVFLVQLATLEFPTEKSEKVSSEPSFTIEETALAPGYLKTQAAVAFVLRNNTRQHFELVFVHCAIYAEQRLLDVSLTMILDLEPLGRTPGKTEPINVPAGVTPDRAECSASKGK